ncbi:DUF3558 domain-containing protein [Nocardia cyriacigeorgica]|uniref:DUF3558 domain-containing protein n=1 Tax=Nocardia cyriacigeorgica TaxID=135487 RepID=A0A6P1CS71_9NOCA|nr:DUF3558 domain-containing protein [Nocardia cyriacigeorgica]MBF6290142.1 DUF3558 domain-containing protein [Nocardia cyriacigeorgica]MBF6424951.1 DUF3558 domain-containing protein [Nocardia cyriacigeorgica]NEW34244.1 DUF3558 domain-containing protein [Nocardia cyriacigeorgica]
MRLSQCDDHGAVLHVGRNSRKPEFAKLKRVVYALLIALSCASCANDDASSEASASAVASDMPKVAAPVGTAPSVYEQVERGIEIDPCKQLGDEAVDRAGFDPGTRRRNDYVLEQNSPYTFIGCTFQFEKEDGSGQHYNRGVTVLSSNIELLKLRERYAGNSTEIEISGRPGFKYTVQQRLYEECHVALASSDGILDIAKTANPSAPNEGSACDRIEEIAAIFVEALPN